MRQADVLFVSHGGGPLPLLGDAGHQEMVACLRQIAEKLKRPEVIVVISAHWESECLAITSAQHPALIYDYYGFPEAAYQIEYPAPGHPAVAEKIQKALTQAGLVAQLDEHRGFDHGLFVPLKILYPEADIPCVQVSLVSHLDPALHLRVGAALRSLDVEHVLVIGSGFSFHNMKAFFAEATEQSRLQNQAFENWLLETLSAPDLNEADRAARLTNWTQAPFARYCHPREEHLLPLHVCYGLVQRACSDYFQLEILNKQAGMVLWQAEDQAELKP